MTIDFSRPLVTVAISLFNYGKFIERALESVCMQTIASKTELIVVDDASTDDSLEVVRNFQCDNSAMISRLASFHCEVHARNRGLAEARNTAFHLARATNILCLTQIIFIAAGSLPA